MKQIFKNLWTLTAATALFAGCSDKEASNAVPQDPYVRIAVSGTTSAAVKTRATTDLQSIIPGLVKPDAGDLHLTLKGDNIAQLETDHDGNFIEVSRFNYSEQWDSLADYEDNQPSLFPGVYAAQLTYGDPNAIGTNAPYYAGSGSVELTRADVGKEVLCSVSVSVANAVVRVAVDEAFRSYFADPSFRLIVNGTETEYLFTAAAGEQPVFVPAGAEVALKGSVYRPSQTADGKGEALEVEVPARTVNGGTLSTFQFSAEAGGLEVSVRFMEPEPGSDNDFEMNDDSK